MTLATDAERFRTMTDAEYADLQDGRTTVEAVLAAPDYADRIAANTPLPATWRADVPMNDVLMAEIVSYGAACAREAYSVGYGAAANSRAGMYH